MSKWSMLRYLLLAACLTLLGGCESTPSLIGTWDGELPEGQTIKTPKGEVRPNLVLQLKADQTFHASVTIATLDGHWERQGMKLILHADKATINGEDVGALKKKMEPYLDMMPPNERAALDAYDPAKPWTLDIQNQGRNLYLPTRGKEIGSFVFHKAS